MAKMGRKTKDTVILNNLGKIEQWLINRNSDEFISSSLGIGYSTWMKYKATLPEIIEIIEKAPQTRASMVEDIKQSLINRAKGFEYEESKTILVTDEETGKPKILRKEIYKKRALSDPTAAKEALFLLGDENSSGRANFDLKRQEFEFKKAQLEAESGWVAEEVDDNE